MFAEVCEIQYFLSSGLTVTDQSRLDRKNFQVAAGFLRCFDEQLDWSLDDIPELRLAYRAKLLGD